uniref:Uncharacterized LOC107321458 n=2 Tax=Coturnix japonica TaxID=93934 RepID=A0A8C2YF67_COTJA
MNVFQVTWQKINGSSFWNIATYSQIHGLRLQESFQRKACFTVAALNTSAIALRNLTSEDASCYRCIFNVFPYGSFSSPDLCLKIQNSGNTNNKIEDKMLGMGSTNTRESVNTSNPEVKKLYVGSTNTRESGNTNNKIEDKMQVIGSPSTRGISGIQKRIDLVVFFLGAVLGTLILLIVGLIKTRRRKLQKRRAHRTPEKEEGLQEDVSEQSVSLETPKVQGSAYQNERQTPGSALLKWLLYLRRNWEEYKERETWKRNKRLPISDKAGSLDSTSRNISHVELNDLSNDMLGCKLMKNSDTEECEESELCPALVTPWPSTGEKSAHQSPLARSPEEN